jgi:hypothetical protein
MSKYPQMQDQVKTFERLRNLMSIKQFVNHLIWKGINYINKQ